MKYKQIVKRETKVMFLIVAVLLVIVLGVSYAMFMQVNDNTNNQIVNTGTLQIEYASSNGYISNNTYSELIPMADSDGLEQKGYEFSVKNTGSLPVTYSVYLYVNKNDYNSDKEASKVNGGLFEDLSYLKYNIQTNNDNNTEINKISDLENKTEDGIIKYKIYSGSVEVTENINTHKLKIWLDENIDASNIGKYVYLKLEVSGYVSGQEPEA